MGNKFDQTHEEFVNVQEDINRKLQSVENE